MDLMTYRPKGDKKNSETFNEYLPKVYDRRRASGIVDLVGAMTAIIIQVETRDGIGFIEECYLMTPYRHAASYLGDTHKIHFLRSRPDFPVLIVLEPLSPDFCDSITRLNHLYPLARPKPNARYVGEVFHSTDLDETRTVLESHDVRFEYAGEVENPFYTAAGFLFSFPSDHTTNRIGYTDRPFEDLDALGFGERIQFTSTELGRLDTADALAEERGIKPLILGVDHMATRILSGEREDAILEFLTMTNYYFWGAYNIVDQNSSTNVNRNAAVDDDKKSPAKVFTANNTASFVNSFEGLPMPTENFVRNYGRRMHHIAQEVKDGDHAAGEKNVDFVVNTLKDLGKPFLADVVGECTDQPNLKQIFSKHSNFTLLITEYVERCFGYEGFFTKDNVAALTQAAGQDEMFKHGHVFD
jgi:hypothetical protein